MNSSDDTTAVNPRSNESRKARMMIPDPMKPHSLYDPNEAPRKSPGADDVEAGLYRK